MYVVTVEYRVPDQADAEFIREEALSNYYVEFATIREEVE